MGKPPHGDDCGVRGVFSKLWAFEVAGNRRITLADTCKGLQFSFELEPKLPAGGYIGDYIGESYRA